MRPLILIDVDGVLSPDFRCNPPFCRCHPGWIKRKVTAEGSELTLILNPRHGKMLLDLAAETGAELAWASTWESWANVCVGPLIGLPELPWAPAPRGRKAPSVVPWTAGRPFVWLEDDPAIARRAAELADQPHLVVLVDERYGLTGDHLAQARAWLNSLGKPVAVPA